MSQSISKTFLTIFSEIKAIAKLNIMFFNGDDIENMENIECFKHCPHLKDLDIVYYELTEDVFTNIQSFLPKLQSLRIRTHQKFSDSFINSFHSMKFIRKVLLFNQNKGFHGKYYYFGKCLTEVMLSPKKTDVIRVTYNCGLIEYN